jgi:hypothetical protein
MDPEEFSQAFAKQTGSLKTSLGGDTDTRLGKALGGLGLVVGGAALATNLSKFTELELKEQINTLSGLAGLGSQTGTFFGASGAAGTFFKALGKGSLGVGTALGMIDFASNMAKGDVPMALTSLASTAGGILMATSLGGPVGTAVGVVLCIGAIGGQLLINHFRQQDLEHEGEQNLEEFMKGAGFSAEDAHRLRDLNGDRQSTGFMFQQAAGRLDMNPQDFLQQVLANVPDDKMSEVIDKAESIPRNDDGTFRETDPSDTSVGQSKSYGRYSRVVEPESVQGWINWMQQQGYL